MLSFKHFPTMAVLLWFMVGAVWGERFKVVSDIPGRAHSLHYKGKVRSVGSSSWTTGFMLETTSPEHVSGDGYWEHLNGWSHSWLNIEVDEPVEVLIERKDKGQTVPVQRAVIHPASSGAQIKSVLGDGSGVIVSVPRPCRFVVDFDGNMDETDTGNSYDGPPVHTVSVFANPLESQPDPSDPSVYFVKAGHPIPLAESLASYTTLLFGPGVHKVPRGESSWREYTLPSNVRVYLPSDAVLHSALNTGRSGAQNIVLEGYGTISGEDLERCPTHDCGKAKTLAPEAIVYNGVHGGVLRGVTVVDFPNHHLALRAQPNCQQSMVSNVKVLGWRANGDGCHVFGNWQVEKLFLRTQDDSIYLQTGRNVAKDCGRMWTTTFDQITTWNDANGASFMVQGNWTTLTNSDVIYTRSAESSSAGGGRVFSHRDGAEETHDVYIKHVRIEDPLPSKNIFNLLTGTTHSVWNLRFKHISIANPSSPSYRLNEMSTTDVGRIYNNSFEDVKIGSIQLRNVFAEHFHVSGHVTDIWLDGKLVKKPVDERWLV